MARKLDRGDDQERLLSDGGEQPPDESRRALTRRSYIGLGASTVASLSVTATGRGSIRRHGIEFDRGLDAVDDLGMDPTGEVPVDKRVTEAGDGSLVQFPDGRYRFGSDGIPLDGGIRGFEGVGEHVSFVAPETDGGFPFEEGETDAVYVGGIAIGRRFSGMRLRGDRIVVRDVERLQSPEEPGATRSPGPDLLAIEGPAHYEFTVDGRIEADGRSVGYPPSGTNTEGLVGSGRERYRIDGRLTDLRLDGGTAYLNGSRIDPGGFGAPYPNELVFGPAGTTTGYAFSVTELSPRTTPNGDGQVSVSDSVTRDRYQFDGAVETLSARGTATLSFGSPGRN